MTEQRLEKIRNTLLILRDTDLNVYINEDDDARQLVWHDIPFLLSHIEELEQANERLQEDLVQALRQWRMYANDARQFEGDWIESADDSESQTYQAICSRHASIRPNG